MTPFLVIGNLENRRVRLFHEALLAQGQPAATLVSWRSCLTDPSALRRLPDTPALVRIDSAGEDAEVERLLLARGLADALAAGVSTTSPEQVSRFGEIRAPRQAHLGFLRVLAELQAVFAERPAWRVLGPPATIAELFDKRITSRRFAAAGVPVPESLDVATPDDLRAAMHARDWPEVYVKLSCGSSASCLALFSRRAGREQLLTTIEQAADGWFNSLRVRRITRGDRVDEILTFLFREGAQVERGVAKARLGADHFDTRVLLVGGEPAFTVVRQSRQPITNLHLGGRRGDPAVLAEAPGLEAALASCRRIARLYPDALHIGVDLLYEPGLVEHRVLEANAFGDLLPGLQRDGLSVYEWEIQVATGGRPVDSARSP